MFRPMRRAAQALAVSEAEAILAQGSAGVLALAGDDGYPYALPMSYVYADGVLYFHSAIRGHKIDAIARDNRASFCVIAANDVVPERFTTRYRSVIAFGRIHVVDNPDEIRAALRKLAGKYAPAVNPARTETEIARSLADNSTPVVCILALTVEHLSGKEGRELAEERKMAP